MNGITALIKGFSYSSLARSTMCQDRERLAVCNPDLFSEMGLAIVFHLVLNLSFVYIKVVYISL